VEIERLIDDHLSGKPAPMDNAFAPFCDTWLFQSPLNLDEIDSRLESLIPAEENDEQPGWLIVQLTGGRFGGFHDAGPKSRLRRLFQ
jgi:hypothetical protein